MRFKLLGALIAIASLVSACRSERTADLAQSADRNVLLITIDTLRSDALSCDGGPARTPTIDAIADAGIRFTFAHAQAVVTLPSHASILTGLYPHQHGYRENAGYRLTPGTQTLATRLKANGFETGAFVAAFPLDARFGLTPGFDIYDGRFDDIGSGAEFLLPERPAPVVVQRAVDWIRARRGRWFAWVHLYEPHAPYRPAPPFDLEYAAQPYYGEVAAADRALVPLVDAVRASSRATLVVVTGDHGEGLGDHGEMTHGLFAYESTLHVPLIVADVSGTHRPRAEVSDAPARHVDIAPTVLDMLGLPVPQDLPGHSLRTRADREGGSTRASYFEAMESLLDFGFAPLDGVLVGREKYIRLPMPELYDLAADRGETVNLIDRAAERVRALSARLEEFHATRPGAQQPESPDVTARLRALGYVSGSAPPKVYYTERDDPKRLVDIDRLMHEAVALDDERRLEDGIEKYRQILARRPDMIAAARHLAFDYWRTGNVAAAIDTLRVAFRATPPTAGAQIQLGTYLSEVGRFPEAIALLQQAVAAEPTLDALNALGIAFARSGRLRDALATFTRSLAIDPANAMTFENIGAVHLDAGQLGEARRSFEQAVASNPESSQGHAGLAMVAIRQGDRKTAIEEWERAVALQPENFDALYDLGIQLAQDGQLEAARRYLTQFVQTAPRGQYGKDIDKVAALLPRLGEASRN
ncbi:MAG TPA: sulfatase-like hydrolase/transferase [Vicinamibacterales bacterium]|nr:sulfatase-like hydrolase/transferase [Vicinamibacterales bacterium]